MSNPDNPTASTTRLRTLNELDRGLELMYYGPTGLTAAADAYLADYGFSSAHHRVLFVIARAREIAVGELARTLGVSNQALHRPLRQLLTGGCVQALRDATRHRRKLLDLTALGRRVEHEASERERDVLRAAFRAEPWARDGWLAVMALVAEGG